MTRMNALLGDRACLIHRDAPVPCLECAGSRLRDIDLKRGGYRGNRSRFEDSEPKHADENREVEASKIVQGWLHKTPSTFG